MISHPENVSRGIVANTSAHGATASLHTAIGRHFCVFVITILPFPHAASAVQGQC